MNKLPQTSLNDLFIALAGNRQKQTGPGPAVDAVSVVAALGGMSRKTARGWYQMLNAKGCSSAFKAGQTAEVAVGTTMLGQAEFTQHVECSVVCACCSADLVIDVKIRTQQGTSSDNPAVLNKVQIDIIDVSITCV